MKKNLTISVDESVIENAKRYAKKNEIRLSKLVENYLRSITKNRTKYIEITSLIKNLSGVISLPEDFDFRDKYTNHLIKKYS